MFDSPVISHCSRFVIETARVEALSLLQEDQPIAAIQVVFLDHLFEIDDDDDMIYELCNRMQLSRPFFGRVSVVPR